MCCGVPFPDGGVKCGRFVPEAEPRLSWTFPERALPAARPAVRRYSVPVRCGDRAEGPEPLPDRYGRLCEAPRHESGTAVGRQCRWRADRSVRPAERCRCGRPTGGDACRAEDRENHEGRPGSGERTTVCRNFSRRPGGGQAAARTDPAAAGTFFFRKTAGISAFSS